MGELFLTFAVAALVVSQYYTMKLTNHLSDTVVALCEANNNIIDIICEIRPDLKEVVICGSSTHQQ
jgi:hypothetical protein